MPTSSNLIGVPWRNAQELKTVAEYIFGPESNIETRIKSMPYLYAWEIQGGEDCPASILATKVVLEAILTDEKNTDGRLSISELSAVCGLAITKFFNFINSSQGNKSLSMYESARELNIDEMIVELRHLFSHSVHMIDIYLLRIGLRLCLDWLHENFWSKCNDITIKKESKNKIRELAMFYGTLLKCNMNDITSIKKTASAMPASTFREISYFARKHKTRTVALTMNEILKELMRYCRSEKYVYKVSNIIRGLKYSSFFFSINQNDYNHEKLIAAVQPFFKKLARVGLIEDFYTYLIESLESEDLETSLRAGYNFWAIQILQGMVALLKLKMKCLRLGALDSTLELAAFKTLNMSVIPTEFKTIHEYNGINIARTLIFGDDGLICHTCIRLPFFIDRLKNINSDTESIITAMMPLVYVNGKGFLNDKQIKNVINLINILMNRTRNSVRARGKRAVAEKTNYSTEDLEAFFAN